MTPIQMWACCVIALWLKTIALIVVQGHQRLRQQAFTRPEDATFFGRGAAPAKEDPKLASRAQQALRNDGETIPLFLAISLAYVLLECWPQGIPWYLGAFVLARFGHSILMLWPKQPWRNLCFSASVCITLALVVHLAHAMFG